MGRRKIPIERIVNTEARQIAFSKRRKGLFKKAYELCTRGCSIALVVFSEAGNAFTFAHPSVELVAARILPGQHSVLPALPAPQEDAARGDGANELDALTAVAGDEDVELDDVDSEGTIGDLAMYDIEDDEEETIGELAMHDIEDDEEVDSEGAARPSVGAENNAVADNSTWEEVIARELLFDEDDEGVDSEGAARLSVGAENHTVAGNSTREEIMKTELFESSRYWWNLPIDDDLQLDELLEFDELLAYLGDKLLERVDFLLAELPRRFWL